MADQTYTDADAAVELAEILHQLCDSPAETAADCGPDRCLGVAHALVAAGWRPPSATGAVIHPTRGEQDAYDAGYAQGCEDAAQAIEAYDGPLSDGPRTTCARIARAHKEASR
jgi:hypothetical protein